MAESARRVREKTFRWKYKSESDAKRARKEKERLRQLSRINIGNQAGRWSAIKTELGIKSHAAFAKLLLDRFFQTELEKNRGTQQEPDLCSSTESCESVHSDDEFLTSSFAEEEQEMAQSPIPGQELENKTAPSESLTSSDEATTAELSENNENRVKDEEDEDFSSSLSGHYQVDLRSSSEFVVDERCILQLFRSCQKCNRRCMVRQRVSGLKIVVNQMCGFCSSRLEWTNLPDEEDLRNDSDAERKAESTAALSRTTS
ncbi:uncharacterized protein LOC106528473 [Austrofundulus limnaeus]|uniref:Uncharacterized protein LOC106528473 n=1 Tax=Austrofundulus limnaeus TaxID=52670 RepID=A0A2I4CGI3_AUSLI|nr:PREDICTED: uncharacterized protein LOC106528473 [Austrofundulus limnaeus]